MAPPCGSVTVPLTVACCDWAETRPAQISKAQTNRDMRAPGWIGYHSANPAGRGGRPVSEQEDSTGDRGPIATHCRETAEATARSIELRSTNFPCGGYCRRLDRFLLRLSISVTLPLRSFTSLALRCALSKYVFAAQNN